MIYEVWDRLSGNRLGTFDSKAEALTFMDEIREDEGAEASQYLTLLLEENE